MTPPDIDRLQALETAESARNLVNRYCTALDNQDLSLLASLFAEDIALDRAPDPPLHGRQAALDFFAGAFEHSVDRRKHFNTNTTVTASSKHSASVSSYFFAFHYHEGNLSLAWGSYHFGIRVSDGEAVITELKINLEVPMAPLSSLI